MIDEEPIFHNGWPVPGWPTFHFANVRRMMPVEPIVTYRAAVIRTEDGREMCEIEGTNGPEIVEHARYALGTIVAEEATHPVDEADQPWAPGALMTAVARMTLDQRVRLDDPLWDDPAGMLAKLREMGLVDGGKPRPRLRTLGWQVLTALSTILDEEARRGAS